MSLVWRVVDASGREFTESYLLRLGGWTEERFFAEAPENQIVEFEEGEIVVPSPATVQHQQLVRFLTFLLAGYVRTKKLGEILNGPAVVKLHPGLVYEPDIFFIRQDMLEHLHEKYFAGPPAFVVEVTSPGTRHRDLKEKMAAYRQHGVPEYWVVEAQEERLYQYVTVGTGQPAHPVPAYRSGRVTSRSIPGFWIEVAWLWQNPLPAELACLQEILA